MHNSLCLVRIFVCIVRFQKMAELESAFAEENEALPSAPIKIGGFEFCYVTDRLIGTVQILRSFFLTLE